MKRLLPFIFLIILLGGGVWAEDQTKDLRLALQKLRERADSGDAKSLFDLARLYESGYDTISIDSVKSLSLYRLSAEKGYSPARNFIGFKYYNGEGLSKDIDSALYWIRLAANDGDVTAAANLGYLLTDSPEIEHDEEEASKWLGIASEAGVLEAQLKLKEIMLSRWEGLTADSALNLGTRYYLGKAPVVGVTLLEIAAEKGSPKAMALIGDAYSKGIGVTYDHTKSLDYFYRAAEAGNPAAQFIIAELLEFFPDAVDGSSADSWYEKAASQGIEDSESAYKSLYSE